MKIDIKSETPWSGMLNRSPRTRAEAGGQSNQMKDVHDNDVDDEHEDDDEDGDGLVWLYSRL